MNFLRLTFSTVLFAIITITFSACKKKESKSKNEILLAVLQDSLHIKQSFEKIIVLNEDGCLSCNKNYSTFLENQTKKDLLFIVGATGSQFNIDYLDSIKKENVIYDYRNVLSKAGILNGSGFILMKDKAIDTIVALDAKTLESQLGYISKKLN